MVFRSFRDRSCNRFALQRAYLLPGAARKFYSALPVNPVRDLSGILYLFSKTFFHTRHLSTTELWYILLVAIGLYVLWSLLYALLPFKGGLIKNTIDGILGSVRSKPSRDSFAGNVY